MFHTLRRWFTRTQRPRPVGVSRDREVPSDGTALRALAIQPLINSHSQPPCDPLPSNDCTPNYDGGSSCDSGYARGASDGGSCGGGSFSGGDSGGGGGGSDY